ncbi:MAG: NADH-quinone oxidoreductase subunit C [Anaerolineaceae bacterium]|nr:NADH-quinone oxidoreductase subunit C [Anaerolineaceae bacterium]
MKNTQTLLADARAVIEPYALRIENPEDFRLDVWLTPDNFKMAATALVNAKWGYLSTITGLDHPGAVGKSSEEKQWEKVTTSDNTGSMEKQGRIELLYHFSSKAAVTSLRVNLPYSNLTLPTICDLIPSASLYEREIIELFGVALEGTPNKDHLILPEDWPEGVYPLRKSFKGLHINSENVK